MATWHSFFSLYSWHSFFPLYSWHFFFSFYSILVLNNNRQTLFKWREIHQSDFVVRIQIFLISTTFVSIAMKSLTVYHLKKKIFFNHSKIYSKGLFRVSFKHSDILVHIGVKVYIFYISPDIIDQKMFIHMPIKQLFV